MSCNVVNNFEVAKNLQLLYRYTHGWKHYCGNNQVQFDRFIYLQSGHNMGLFSISPVKSCIAWLSLLLLTSLFASTEKINVDEFRDHKKIIKNTAQ